MQIPFSELPEETLHDHISRTLDTLGNLERICALSGADVDVSTLCITATILVGAIKSIVDGDLDDACIRVQSSIEQLQDLNLR